VTLTPVEFISNDNLEHRATQLLRRHQARRKKPITLPVPIESIIEDTLGLHLIWIPIEERPGEIILARIDPSFNGAPTIQMNENRRTHFDQYFGTEAYSLAHEAGHWDLHYAQGTRTGSQLGLPGLDAHVPEPVLCRRMNDGDRREWQAERFAAYVLMPADLVMREVAGRDVASWTAIADLARRCGVSKLAMQFRLEDLGVIEVGPRGPVRRGDDAGMSRMF
jgi:hypothetical protein